MPTQDQIEALQALPKGQWTLTAEVAATLGVPVRKADYRLRALLAVGLVDLRVVGATWNPIHDALKARGAKVPTRMGFFVWRPREPGSPPPPADLRRAPGVA